MIRPIVTSPIMLRMPSVDASPECLARVFSTGVPRGRYRPSGETVPPFRLSGTGRQSQ